MAIVHFTDAEQGISEAEALSGTALGEQGPD
jgi:hypothetical protein